LWWDCRGVRGIVERDEREEVARVVHRRGANAQCYFDTLVEKAMWGALTSAKQQAMAVYAGIPASGESRRGPRACP
jgi:hypothetical protein